MSSPTAQDAAAMSVDVPAGGVRTVYPMAGDVVAWLSLIGLAAFTAAALAGRKRRAGRKEGNGNRVTEMGADQRAC